MNDDREYENGRHKMEYYRGAHSLVNRIHTYLVCFLLFYLAVTLLDWLIGFDLKCAVEYGPPASSKGTKCPSYE